MPNIQSIPRRICLAGIALFCSTVLWGQSVSITEFSVPTTGSKPANIAVAPNGDIAFTESNSNKIGRINTAGKFSEVPVLTPNSQPYGIRVRPV